MNGMESHTQYITQHLISWEFIRLILSVRVYIILGASG